VTKGFERQESAAWGDPFGGAASGPDDPGNMGSVTKGIQRLTIGGEVAPVGNVQGMVHGYPGINHGHRHTITVRLLPERRDSV
jgi:hypothetical protein